MKRINVLLMCTLLGTSAHASNAEHVLWDKTPIHINLTLNQERLVEFPSAIRVIESEPGDSISVLKVRDTLYLKALDAFDNKRLLIQVMPQGEVIILSLSADDKPHTTESIDVLLDNKEQVTQQDNKSNFDLNAITLTRFAIQSLYAPDRLLTIPEGVSRTPMQTRRNIPLFLGASIIAHPIASWHGGDFYVTAIELKNQLTHDIILDPRHLIGNWQTAAFYPTNTLSGRGHDDTSTLFLVSDRPFHEALQASREFVR